MEKLFRFFTSSKTYRVNRVVDADENLVEISPHWLFADRLGNRIVVASVDDRGTNMRLDSVVSKKVELEPQRVDEFGRLVAGLHIA